MLDREKVDGGPRAGLKKQLLLLWYEFLRSFCGSSFVKLAGSVRNEKPGFRDFEDETRSKPFVLVSDEYQTLIYFTPFVDGSSFFFSA